MCLRKIGKSTKGMPLYSNLGGSNWKRYYRIGKMTYNLTKKFGRKIGSVFLATCSFFTYEFTFIVFTAKLIIELRKFSLLPSGSLNLLQPTGHVMHQQFNIQQLYGLPTLYLCVLYLSENNQRLVPLTA